MSCPPSKGDPSPHRLFTLKICRCQSQGGGTEGLIWEDSEGKNIFATLRSPQCPQGSLPALWGRIIEEIGRAHV